MAAISVIPGDMDTGEYLMKKLSKILAGTCFGIVSHLRRKSNIRKFGFNASLPGQLALVCEQAHSSVWSFERFQFGGAARGSATKLLSRNLKHVSPFTCLLGSENITFFNFV